MIIKTDEEPLQAIQNRSVEEDVGDVPTVFDKNLNRRVVYWNDIGVVFDGAQSIWNENSLVPFLKDENLEPINPLRITYHPEDVLKVVVEDHSQHNGTGNTSGPSLVSSNPEPKDLCNDLCGQCSARRSDDTNATPDNTVDVEVANLHHDNHSQVSGSGIDQSLGLHLQQPQEQSLQGSQQQPAQDESQEIRVEMAEECEQIVQLQKIVNDNHDLIAQLQQNADEIQHRQNVAINKMSAIIHRVQHLLSNTHELHNHLVPRLFIVLPKTTGPTALSTGQFRLYFLCECHSHSTSDGSRTPHHVHMAKHEGYDLDNPGVFFGKYRSYILAMMFMIKYGAVTGDIVVPPLASLSILDGIETDQEHLDYLKTNIVPLVDHMIDILQDPKSNGGTESEIEKVEALTGTELGHLESYLSVQDEPFSLGRLFRIVTTSGHVKWVCSDHYSANYRSPVVSQLKEIVESSGGMFIEETGKMEIKVTSSADARVLYDTMIQAQRTQDVDIVLDWEATVDDVHDLYESITKANVVRLSVDGTQLKDSETDNGNQSRGIHPVLQLAFNSRIQSLHIRGFKNLFTRVTKSGLVPAPMLRVLSVEVLDVLDDGSIEHLNDILECCPGLETLDVISKQLFHVQESIIESLSKMRKFQWLKVDYGLIHVTSRFQDGKCQEMTATVECHSKLNWNENIFLEEHNFNHLVMNNTLFQGPAIHMTNVLDAFQLFTHLRVERSLQFTTDMSKRPPNAFWKHMMIHCFQPPPVHKTMPRFEVPTRPKLESFSFYCPRLSLAISYSPNDTQVMSLVVQRLSDLRLDDLIFIRQGHLTHLTIASFPRIEDEGRLVELLCCNPRLTRIDIQQQQQVDNMAGPELGLLELIDMMTSGALPNLESLSISCERFSLVARLSPHGPQSATISFDRSDDLSSNDVEFIRECPFDQLTMEYTDRKDEGRLTEIIHNSLATSFIHLRRRGERCLTIVNTIDTAPQGLMNLTSEFFGTLESLSVDCGKLFFTANAWQGNIQDVDMTIRLPSRLNTDDLVFIQQHHPTRLAIEQLWETDKGRLSDVLHHCPELCHLQLKYDDEAGPAIPSIARKSWLKFQDLIMVATLDSPSMLESLSVDTPRLSLTASFSRGQVLDVTTTIARLHKLYPDDLSLIRGSLTRMAIKQALCKENESQLVDILHQNPNLLHLQIGCNGSQRFLTILNLVLSEREKIIQEHGSSSLRSFELMSEGLVSFDALAECDTSTQIQTRLSFPENSDSFDMRTWIHLGKTTDANDTISLYDFVCRYGWSVVFLNEGSTNTGSFASILEEIPNTRTPQLESLWVKVSGTQTFEVDHMNKIVQGLPNFKDLGFSVDIGADKEFKMAQSLLLRYRASLSQLRLSRGTLERWSWITSVFPTRRSFPAIESLELSPGPFMPTQDLIRWIIGMVSAPPQGKSSSSQPVSESSVSDWGAPRPSPGSTESWTPLRKIILRWVDLKPCEWIALLEAIDFSVLEHLDVCESTFAQEQFSLLVERISEIIPSSVVLKTLEVGNTDLVRYNNPTVLSAIFGELLNKNPSVKIVGGNSIGNSVARSSGFRLEPRK